MHKTFSLILLASALTCIHRYVCVCVYVHICMHVMLHVGVDACLCIYAYVQVCICMCGCGVHQMSFCPVFTETKNSMLSTRPTWITVRIHEG